MEKLRVIILNYNDSQNTIRICKEYKKMDIVDRIVIVDNCSPEGAFTKLSKLKCNKVDVIKTEANKGYAAGNNFGIKFLEDKYGPCQYICISNPDIYIDNNSIKACIEYLDKNKKVAICAPKMLDVNGKEHPLSGWKLRSIRGDIWDSSLLLTKIIKRPHIEMYDQNYMSQKEIVVDCVAGSFFIIKNNIFKQIGYFDEKTFLYFEEDILGNKIKKLGYKNVILNDYKFTHLESVSVDRSMKFMKKFRNLQKSKIYYHRKYNNANLFKIGIMYFFTYFRYIEQMYIKLKSSNFIRKLHNLKKKIGEVIFRIYKILILIMTILTCPITYLIRIFHKNKKVMYYSVVNWKWIKQRPHFVPLYLCEHGYSVDYVYDEPYSKYLPNQNNILVNNEEKHKHLKIKPFKYLPYYVKKSWINRFIFVTRTFLFNYDKIIFTNPKQVSNLFMTILKIKGTKLYYECMDNYIYWEPENNKVLYNGYESWLINHSEKVIVSSLGLKKLLISKHHCNSKKIVLIRNGYENKVFESYEKTPLELKHPNAVYIGTIDEWFDFESIIKYARKNRNKYFYIIGPTGWTVEEKVKKIDEKNIIFHGPIEHKYVPGTIENSDVMLLPFIINDLIEDVDPVKVYEYLYLKKPVVSSYWKELDQFKEFTIFYKDKNDFEKAMNKAFKSKIDESINYKKLMNESSWDQRLKKYLDAIK